ncbi:MULTISPECIES: TlpA family protein disulfide reductase [Rufibacter]|uniref:Thiol-disulfide isomerase/thioredoxin n=1 Tax=Rufibacter quisquiliarum TaxID=1549639 RepID=A0A839GNV2_9BACT|nr:MULTISPECIES: TlpA disulfide reductase family protein [Rufibacter]MBA9079633.1 thiol-disulfide isomerase/thioredoxin [Rufibacter quisquiliarum]
MAFRRTIASCFFVLCLLAAGTGRAQGQRVPLVKLPHLQRYLTSPADTTYIINFWATWCKPCVEELPHFEALQKEYAQKPVKVILVSLDFAKDLEKKVIPFVNRNKLQSTVFVLDEPDQNAWIPLVDPSWSGAIPATLLLNGARKQRFFVEKPLSPAQLKELLTSKFPLNP